MSSANHIAPLRLIINQSDCSVKSHHQPIRLLHTTAHSQTEPNLPSMYGGLSVVVISSTNQIAAFGHVTSSINQIASFTHAPLRMGN